MAHQANRFIAVLAALLVALTLPAPAVFGAAPATTPDASFCADCCAASAEGCLGTSSVCAPPDAARTGAAETPNQPCGAWGAGIVRAACIAPARAPQSFVPALLQLSSAYLVFGRLLL